MINRQQLLADLKPILKEVEADLRARCDEVPQIDTDLKQEYEQARAAHRTGVTYEEWRSDLITQVAVAWVLSCVFVRFLEDNALVAPPRISGPLHGAGADAGLMRARDERETYFKTHPKHTDRDYLLSVFDALAKLPGGGTKDVFGPHNPALAPAYRHWLSGDAAQKLIEFFQKINADTTGEIVHDFTDPITPSGAGGGGWDTRFLGDLYQDLSEATRKKYALLQTPIFVEEFILDRTLEPALAEFGLKDFKMIDPACGSGHFLLGGFARILKHWRKKEPGTSERELVNRALAAVHGVDLNPYAIAIARFRLLIAAMRECHITRLAEVPAFVFNLACGDSLMHGERPTTSGVQTSFDPENQAEHYSQVEDREKLVAYLCHGQYHAVVANPPYITVKDRQQNENIRHRYSSCHMKYALTVPFMERIFDLAIEGTNENGNQSGFTGQITSNSFMKREFGKKLVENHLRRWDLTHVIDTSGAYIPGCGTPTVILFGRNRKPVAPTLRTAMGIAGEPVTPEDPAHGLVWTAILNQVNQPGSQSQFISVNDSPREAFHKHPWSIGGGGASELKETLDEQKATTLIETIARTGIGVVTLEDDAFAFESSVLKRLKVPQESSIGFVEGDTVRDWSIQGAIAAIFPYDSEFSPQSTGRIIRTLWPCRTGLRNRIWFAKTQDQRGMYWFEYGMLSIPLLRIPMSIVFGFVATHNHFVLHRDRSVFNRSAPVIKLPVEATEDDHLALMGLLNSAVACFWMKQIFFPKGGDHVGQEGARVRRTQWDERYEFVGNGMDSFPIPSVRPLALARRIDELARAYAQVLPEAVCRRAVPDAQTLAQAREQAQQLRGQMIALQEELDWQCYRLYGLVPEKQAKAYEWPDPQTLPTLQLGERAFEIVLARQMQAGEIQTTWFTRHGSTPITEIPAHWPKAYRTLVQNRIDLIAGNHADNNIALIERPEYKRRWNTEPWDEQQERALRGWLLDRLESYFDFDGRMSPEAPRMSPRSGVLGAASLGRARLGSAEKQGTARGDLHEPRLTSVAKVADLARADKDFMQVAELFTGRMDFDIGSLVNELVSAESVPALPVLRYKPAAMDKRKAWERTWELQRLEDAVDALFDLARLKTLEPSKAEATLKPLVAALPIDEQAKPQVLKEALAAAGYVTEAVKQKLNLDQDTIQKPVHDAARRARKAAVGDIPVPPKYTSADFQNGNYWRLRGKLDVPKERWVSFPHCEGEDGTLVIAWAGYNHLQLAKAIAEYSEYMKDQHGRKLVPLLAAIGQLIPWLKQWHNDPDMAFGGTRMGNYFEEHLAQEAKAIGQSVEDVMRWTPPEKVMKTGRKKHEEEA